MLNINPKYNCGCGFTTDKEKEAIDHVKKTKHSVKISGMITI